MPDAIPSAWQAAIQRVHHTHPWRWLWQIEADRTDVARSVFQIHAGTEIIEFLGSNWYPVPMAQSEIVTSGEGDLPAIALTISNATRMLAPYLHVGEGFMGRPVAGYLVNLHDLSDWSQISFRVSAAELSDEAVTVRLEMPNFFRRIVPFDRYTAARCRWVFGGRECGYVINAAGAFTDCPKDLPSCVARGLDMKSRNLPQLQPGRFGAFVGIPQR